MKYYQNSFTLTICNLVLTALTFIACGDSIPYPKEKLSGNTVIVYMGAENSLSADSYSDLSEMKSACQQIPEDCQVVVYKDAELKPAIFQLTKKGMTTWKEYKQDINSADPSVMKQVLQDIISGFPSNKYSLILWSHGTGWVNSPSSRSIIVDNGQNSTSNRGSWIHVSELSDILATLPHMEYIFFDACYMQSVEVAAELYTHASYIIGSPTEIPSEGAPYHLIMKDLCKANIQGIINGYASGYTGYYGVLLSAVSSYDFPTFCKETAMVIPQAFRKDDMPITAGIQLYAPAYGTSIPKQGDMPVPYDMRSAMNRLLDEESYLTWEQQWKKTILYPVKATRWASMYPEYNYGPFHRTMQDEKHYGGISMNIPDTKYDAKGWNTEWKQSEWYRLTNWEITGW